jgi:hypothetical protein
MLLRDPASQPDAEPAALHARALADLTYIRDTMERAGQFTAVSGRAQILAGLIALAAAWIASRQGSERAWVGVWLAAAAIAACVSAEASRRKARRAGTGLLSGPGRRFVLSFSLALLVGALLTPALLMRGEFALLPGTWLLLYGTGIAAGGAFSAPVVPLMGLGFIGLGGAALFAPSPLLNPLMAAGFGGLHLGFGVLIARRHGG